ncbi:MAG: T9SS C-terminal target domain-containing protein [Cytophagales bacterium]|nr:MAG: T9SS C-terminal target domain-containing protein [Cytophagales bacterium]
MIHKKNLTFALLLIIFSNFVTQAQVALPPGFRHQQVGKFDLPVNIASLPNNKMLFPTQNGKLFMMENGILDTKSILSLDSIWWQFEKGFLGVEADPDFVNNGYIYCYYTISVTGNTYDGSILRRTSNNGTLTDPIMHKITRYTLSGHTVVPNSKKTILDMDITPGVVVNYNHDGGTIRFGRDGKLYVATGEGDLWCPCFTPKSTNCSWSCGSCPSVNSSTGCKSYQWATNMGTFYGKILRINSDGSAPTDNPYYANAPYNAQKYVYALGFRNPFSMNFKPGTDDLYIGDVGSHGTDKREEINKLTPTSVKDFGWPAIEGVSNDPAYTDPIFTYNEGNTTNTGCAITGGTFYNPQTSNWPAQYTGKYLYMDFCNGWINTLDFDNGNTVSGFVTGLANNFGNATSGVGILTPSISSTGELYYLARGVNANTTGIYKISFQPITVSGITMTGGNVINTPTTLAFEAGIQPTNASDALVLWDVQPRNLASISFSGVNANNAVLTPIQDGVVTVTAISSGDITKKQLIVVTISGQTPLTFINITTTSNFSITSDNGTLQLGIDFVPSNFSNKTILWSVSKKSINVDVTLDINGLLTSIGENGTVTIVGTSASNSAIQSTKVVTITGQNPLTAINITASTFTITTDNGTLQLGMAFTPANFINKSITWSISNQSSNVLASINSSGLLSTNGGNGTVTILGTSVANASISSSKVITITGQTIEPTSISIAPQNGTLSTTVNGTIAFNATVLPTNAIPTPTITWSVITGTGGGSVNSNGVFTALSMGVVTVVAQVSASVKTSFVVSVTSLISSVTIKSESNKLKYNDIKLYPVPNNGEFMIESIKLIPQTTLSITNIEGQTVFSTPLTNFIGVKKISVPSLAKGIYRVSFSLENGSMHYRMVVE